LHYDHVVNGDCVACGVVPVTVIITEDLKMRLAVSIALHGQAMRAGGQIERSVYGIGGD